VKNDKAVAAVARELATAVENLNRVERNYFHGDGMGIVDQARTVAEIAQLRADVAKKQAGLLAAVHREWVSC
jgi:recombinational DNA repair protein (RecF pathway)